MSRTFLALCAVVCLIQTVLSQECACNQISYGPAYEVDRIEKFVTAPSISVNVNRPNFSVPSYGASYGGSGTGKVGVSGDIGASGQTVVVGAVPVLGSVDFRGTVPASGSVSISGQCGCGCY